jgi:pimeloyl-ACP methyl ester carboxylesterase
MIDYLASFAVFLCSALALQGASPPITVETGEINGAKFTLAIPRTWNQRLLLLAHGFRAADQPLVADLFPDHIAYRTLIDEGWIVAKTSYRRNGIIVADAIADLDALREHIATKFGPPDRVLVEGESMGGLIATLIAERAPVADQRGRPIYTGAVAIGAALVVQENGAAVRLSLQPHLPLLFLTNQSELSAPHAYVTAKVRREKPELLPVLFRIARDGHVNVNQRERLAALRAVNAWLDRGRDALPKPTTNADAFDATVPPEPLPSQVALHADRRGLDARVVEISGDYGNVSLNVQPADLAALGVAPMQWLQLTAHDQNFRVRLGTDFNSVKRGEWVVFPNADGFVCLARNSADAAATARVTVGDTVTLRRYEVDK